MSAYSQVYNKVICLDSGISCGPNTVWIMGVYLLLVYKIDCRQ